MKSGTLGAQVGTEKIILPAGEAAAFAAGTRHKWWNAGDDLLEFSGQAIPAVDLDQYLQGVFAVLKASPNGRPSIFYLAHLLPVILFIGRIVGKYRESSSPGSPESCLGAGPNGANADFTATLVGHSDLSSLSEMKLVAVLPSL